MRHPLASTLLLLTVAAGCHATTTTSAFYPTQPLPTYPRTPSAPTDLTWREVRRPDYQRIPPPPPRWETVARSVEQRPIETLRLGLGPDRVLLIGAIHGDEPEGLALTERFADELQGHPETLRGRTVLFIRDLNPDGTHHNTRQNARSVDLNRNFPARNWQHVPKGRFASGPSPASEPETEALLNVLDSFRPSRIVVMHGTRDEPLVNYDGPALDLARRMAQHNRYRVAESIGYPTPGSLGSYAGIDLGIPIITLELPRRISDDRAWNDNHDALLALVEFGAAPAVGCCPPEPAWCACRAIPTCCRPCCASDVMQLCVRPRRCR